MEGFLGTFDVTAAIHMGLWLKNTTWDMSSMQCIAWAIFFWLPFPPWESPNTLLPCAKNDDSLHLPVFSITKKQNLRKPYHKPTTLPKMNIISTFQGFLSQRKWSSSNCWGQKSCAKILVFRWGVHGSRWNQQFNHNFRRFNRKLGKIVSPSFVNLQKQWHFLSTRNTRQQSMLVVQKLRLQLDLDGGFIQTGLRI